MRNITSDLESFFIVSFATAARIFLRTLDTDKQNNKKIKLKNDSQLSPGAIIRGKWSFIIAQKRKQ